MVGKYLHGHHLLLLSYLCDLLLIMIITFQL
jgi:hypothetical protein